ncbi:hypothetical protein Tco_0898762 [Tanacetum coccineum]
MKSLKNNRLDHGETIRKKSLFHVCWRNNGSNLKLHVFVQEQSKGRLNWKSGTFSQLEKEIGSGLKKHFEDGVVKRENLQPNEEVEIARHASRGNWRREKRKTRFKLPAYVMMSIEHMLTHSSNTFMNIYVDGVTLKESGKTAYLFSGGFRQMINVCLDACSGWVENRARPSQQPTLPNNEQISQMGLQSLSIRLAEMRIKRRNSGQRMHHMLLPQDLQESVRSYDQYKWLTVTNFKIRVF